MISMNNKRIGDYTVDYTDNGAPWGTVIYHYNDAVWGQIAVRNIQDLYDLEHVVACMKRCSEGKT